MNQMKKPLDMMPILNYSRVDEAWQGSARAARAGSAADNTDGLREGGKRCKFW